MKNTWLRIFIIFYGLFNVIVSQQECTFPESDIEPFFFDVKADTPIDSIIVDTVVDPPNAQLAIVNIRSNNLPNIDFTNKFRIEQRSNGQFMVINKDYLYLPDYPSFINETYLYMTVICNAKAYPLITIRIRNFNSFYPKFYNYPYEVRLPESISENTIIDTPILALDKDPGYSFNIKYDIESGQASDEFMLISSTTEFHKLRALPNSFKSNSKWHPEQLPPIVKLLIKNQPRKNEYNLNISATVCFFIKLIMNLQNKTSSSKIFI